MAWELRSEQNPQRRGRVRLRHQMLPDQECVKSRRTETVQVLMRAQTGFTDGNAFLRNGLDQFVRCLDSDFECAKVTVVHAQDARAHGQRPGQLLPGVNFDEWLHSKLTAEREQLAK